MRKKKAFSIEGHDAEIVAMELTPPQLDELWESIKSERLPHMAELLLDPLLPVEVVTLSTGLTSEQLASDFAPSELAVIWKEVGEVNDFLSGLLGRLSQEGKKIMTEKKSGASFAE